MENFSRRGWKTSSPKGVEIVAEETPFDVRITSINLEPMKARVFRPIERGGDLPYKSNRLSNIAECHRENLRQRRWKASSPRGVEIMAEETLSNVQRTALSTWTNLGQMKARVFCPVKRGGGFPSKQSSRVHWRTWAMEMESLES